MTRISPSNIKRFIAAASLALAIPMAVAAAQGGPRGGGDCGAMEGRGGHHGMHGGEMGRSGHMGAHYLRGLNLTEGQRDKVFEIQHAQAPVMRDKAKALRKAEDDLRKLTSAAEYNEAGVRAQADAVGKAVFEMTLARAHGERQIFDVLTPEQRQQAAEMKQAGRGKGSSGMGGQAPTPPVR